MHVRIYVTWQKRVFGPKRYMTQALLVLCIQHVNRKDKFATCSMLFLLCQMVRIEKLKIGNTFENPIFFHPLPSSPGNFLLSHCFSQKAETSHSLSQARAVSLGHWQIQPKKSVVVFQACIILQNTFNSAHTEA